MIHFSLFSGIGGFELASEWAGWNNYLSCDINEFGNKILSYYWPEAYHHKDIHTLNNQVIDHELTTRYGSQWRSDDIILTGGFPCQPYSAAGKRLGKEDDRHLWPEMLRVIREVKPTWVVGENVLGLVNWNDGLVFNEVQADLEAEGYEVQSFVLPAASVNAPHKRDRVWFIAYSDSFRSKGHSVNTTTSQEDGQRRQSIEKTWNYEFIRAWQNFPTQSSICGGDDGLPNELDGITFSKWRNESIKAYGNAIVPQVAYQIFKAINEYNDL
jgi:DNA (cytosine-5)-methyltransferase 1